MSALHIVQLSLSWFFIVAVALPFVRNDYWVFRILEYPRYQKLILCVVILVSFFATGVWNHPFGLITFILLALAVVYLAYKVFPYTPLAKKEMTNVKGGNKDNGVRLYTANIFLENKKYATVISQIKQAAPDLIMLLETDKTWEQEMNVLLKDFPHSLREPLDNTYGMLFYSKFPIKAGGIKYLVEADIPSLEVTLELPSGQLVKVWGLHPKPPVPGEDTRSTAKDKEIMKVALKVRDEQLPCIVMGDLNDVAWSHVTELFRKTSNLLDPRRGRGFYSTFSANHWLMRFPLDYVFCSAHFGLVTMRKLPHNGSDHFPMFSHFEFQPELKAKQDEPEADADELEEAAEKSSQ